MNDSFSLSNFLKRDGVYSISQVWLWGFIFVKYYDTVSH
jgi:hypothetical protein